MDNAQLIGLSRQVALARNLEVVANNIANLNTTGFKGDNAIVRGVSVARRPRRARRRGGRYAAQLRSGSRRLAGFQPGRHAGDRQSARCCDCRRRVPRRCSRRTASATPVTARCRSAQTVSWSRMTECRSWAKTGRSRFSPAIAISRFRKMDASPSTKARIHGPKVFAESFASCDLPSRNNCRRTASSNFLAPDGVTPEPATTATVQQSFIEKSNINGVLEMTRLIDITRTYTQIANMIQQQSDLRRTAIQQLADVPA